MADEERPGPPPLTEDVLQERPPVDFEAPGRTDTDGLELDRSSFSAARAAVRKATPLPSPPAAEAAPSVASDTGRLLGTGVACLLALVVCLLPAYGRERIRRRLSDLPLRPASVITGIAEMTAAFFLGLEAMLDFTRSHMEAAGPVIMNHVLKYDVPPETMYQMYQVQGATLWLAFLVSPVGLLLAFFVLEGATRILAAVVGKEVMGTLPLWLLDRVRWLVVRQLARSRRRPSPVDHVVKDEQGMLVSIQSARAYAWDHTTTLQFEGRLYVVEERLSSEDGERPYRYRVREAPAGHLIRKLTEYAPAP